MQLPAERIHDAIDAVFSDPAFQRSSLLERFGDWLLGVVGAFLQRLGPAGFPPAVFWVLATTAALAVLVLLARGVVIRGVRAPAAGAARRSSDRVADPWTTAGSLAARGDYTAAAHALYAALLGFVSRSGGIELHESKTIGDYARELSLRSPSRLTPFRDFGRSYERVIYGEGSVDRAAYDRLHALAQRLVERGG